MLHYLALLLLLTAPGGASQVSEEWGPGTCQEPGPLVAVAVAGHEVFFSYVPCTYFDILEVRSKEKVWRVPGTFFKYGFTLHDKTDLPVYLPVSYWTGGANCCTVLEHFYLDETGELSRLPPVDLGHMELADCAADDQRMPACYDWYVADGELTLRVTDWGLYNAARWSGVGYNILMHGLVRYQNGRFRWIFEEVSAGVWASLHSLREEPVQSDPSLLERYLTALFSGELPRLLGDPDFQADYPDWSENERADLYDILVQSHYWDDLQERYGVALGTGLGLR